MSAIEALSLRGQLVHLGDAYAGRIGKALLIGLQQQCVATDPGISPQLASHLRTILAVISDTDFRVVPLSGTPPRRVTVYTDASFHLDKQGQERMRFCSIISCRLDRRWGFVSDVPESFLRCLPDRATQITTGEALAVWLSAFHFKEDLCDASAIFFLDNMGALCGLATGASKAADISALCVSLHVLLLRIACWPWFEYVQSKSNIADGGSRTGTSDAAAAEAGIRLNQIVFPDIPSHFVQMGIVDWELFWHSRTALCRDKR